MSIQHPAFTRVLRLRLKDKHARALRERAYWVNQVWNYCNDLSIKVLRREHRLLSGFDFAPYLKGLGEEGVPLHSQTIQAIAEEYATRRKQFKKARLRWRVSNPDSSKYSLGWIPFKASAISYRNGQVQFSGLGPLSLWDSYGLSSFELGAGSFSEDARGRWYLNISVKVRQTPTATSGQVLGIDLGLKTAATASNGARLTAKHYHRLEKQLATAQRARKKDRVRAISAKIRNQRKDALQAKAAQPLEVFLARDPKRLAAIRAQAKRPLKDAAAVNSTRWALVIAIRATGLAVETASGGKTKFNRSRLGVPKSHALDAACVGEVQALSDWSCPTQTLKCSGRGSYQRTRLDAYGFPRGYLLREKSVKGFQTGDHVVATVPAGKKAGIHVGRVAIRRTGSFNIQTATGVVQASAGATAVASSVAMDTAMAG